MTITVRFFALARDRAGVDQVQLEVPVIATVDSVSKAIGEKYPSVAPMLPKVAFAINQSYVTADVLLKDGDELAVIPPVSGGNLGSLDR